jgi:hypothetical protein
MACMCSLRRTKETRYHGDRHPPQCGSLLCVLLVLSTISCRLSACGCETSPFQAAYDIGAAVPAVQ